MAIDVLAIIQARMGSTRLPGKMMLPLHGVPVVEWVFRRIKRTSLLQNIVFAIPETKENNILHWIADTLPSKLYADASHPLTRGYRELAEKMLDQESFTEWIAH